MSVFTVKRPSLSHCWRAIYLKVCSKVHCSKDLVHSIYKTFRSGLCFKRCAQNWGWSDPYTWRWNKKLQTVHVNEYHLAETKSEDVAAYMPPCPPTNTSAVQCPPRFTQWHEPLPQRHKADHEKTSYYTHHGIATDISSLAWSRLFPLISGMASNFQ